MIPENASIQAWLAFITELEADLERTERRIEAAQRDRDVVAAHLETTRAALRLFCERYGIALPGTESQDELRERWNGMTVKEMVFDAARMQGGVLIVKQTAQMLASAGMFRDARNAAGNIHAVISRNPDSFQRVRRGEYALIEQPQLSFPEPDTSVVPLRPYVDERVLVGAR